jgi:hypothetical protein
MDSSDRGHRTGLRRRRGGAWAAVVLLGLSLAQGFRTPAMAHDMGGLFQPSVSDFVIEPAMAGDGAWEVWARVVDADSGRPAVGVKVVAHIGDQSVELPEISDGFYDGTMRIAVGTHPAKLTVTSLPGGVLVRKWERSWTPKLDPSDRAVLAGAGRMDDLMAARQSPEYARRLAAAKEGADLRVDIEEAPDADPSQPLFLHLLMKTVSRTTGKPVTTEYRLYGYGVDSSGNQTDFQEFNPLDVVDPGKYPPGVYGGLIILPRGGEWQIHADVLALKKTQNDPPLHMAEGHFSIRRESGRSLSALNAADRAAKPKANAFNEVVLAVHTLAAGAWAAVLGILVLFTFRRAKFLSTWGRNVIEQHLDLIVRSAFVTTLIVIVTGIFNIYREAPYKLTSPDRISKVIDLPFGKPYFTALVVKLAVYAVLLGQSAWLIRRARQSTRLFATTRSVPSTSGPWGAVAPARERGRPGGGAVAPATAAAGATMVVEAVREAPDASAKVLAGATVPAGNGADRPDRRFEFVLLPSMLALGTVLVCAVTVLKAAHLLIEVTRLSP